MSNISDKAVVSPKAKIGNNVTIYPFVYIEDDVEIGDDCIIYPNVNLMNGTADFSFEVSFFSIAMTALCFAVIFFVILLNSLRQVHFLPLIYVFSGAYSAKIGCFG